VDGENRDSRAASGIQFIVPTGFFAVHTTGYSHLWHRIISKQQFIKSAYPNGILVGLKRIMKVAGIIFTIVIVACFVTPGVLAADDIIKKASDLTLPVPTRGSAMLGTNESMNEYRGSLLDSANSLIAFFMQIMSLFGMSDAAGTQNMMDTFQSGIPQGYGSGSNTQNTPVISPTATPKPGSIMLRTTPGGVQVFIDDQYEGSTPDDSSKVLVINDIPIGSHYLDLRKPGYTFKRENIQVNDGNWIVFFKELQAVPS